VRVCLEERVRVCVGACMRVDVCVCARGGRADGGGWAACVRACACGVGA